MKSKPIVRRKKVFSQKYVDDCARNNYRRGQFDVAFNVLAILSKEGAGLLSIVEVVNFVKDTTDLGKSLQAKKK